MTKNDPTAARLVKAYGCSACRHQQIEDDFLTEHSRYWCAKVKRSFCAEDRQHESCQHWGFNGDPELVEQLDQPRLPEVQK